MAVSVFYRASSVVGKPTRGVYVGVTGPLSLGLYNPSVSRNPANISLGGPGLGRWAGVQLGEVLVLLDRGWAGFRESASPEAEFPRIEFGGNSSRRIILHLRRPITP
jgi:hypothetical protein